MATFCPLPWLLETLGTSLRRDPALSPPGEGRVAHQPDRARSLMRWPTMACHGHHQERSQQQVQHAPGQADGAQRWRAAPS